MSSLIEYSYPTSSTFTSEGKSLRFRKFIRSQNSILGTGTIGEWTYQYCTGYYYLRWEKWCFTSKCCNCLILPVRFRLKKHNESHTADGKRPPKMKIPWSWDLYSFAAALRRPMRPKTHTNVSPIEYPTCILSAGPVMFWVFGWNRLIQWGIRRTALPIYKCWTLSQNHTLISRDLRMSHCFSRNALLTNWTKKFD